MSRRPAKFTQEEVRRAVAGARQAGASAVELCGGAVVIRLDNTTDAPDNKPNDVVIL
jgi:hypothetical protein